MRITLVQPAMGHDGRGYVASWQMQPLSVATLAALTPPEHQVTFFDDRMETVDYDAPTDLVAITVETYTARRAYQIAQAYRARGVPVVMGGYHATLVPDEVACFADAVVIGDAEGTWERVLSDAARGSLEPRYLGGRKAGLSDVLPDRRLFSGKRYVPLGLVETGRGCRFTCDFCAVSAFSEATWRPRAPKEVARDIEADGHRRVFLVDDNLTADRDRAKALLRELAPLEIGWVSQASIQTADDPELLDLLEKSGCTMLLLGFESLGEETLRSMNKSFNRGTDRFREAIAKLRDRGIKLYATFVFGYDTDTPDLFERTLDFALEQRFFVAAFNHLQPFPGTPLYDRLAREGRLLHDRWWLDPDYRFGRLAFRPTGSTPEGLYERLRAMRRRFYGARSLLHRATDLKANVNDPFSVWMYLAVNGMLRRELTAKWATPLGEVGLALEGEPFGPSLGPILPAVEAAPA